MSAKTAEKPSKGTARDDIYYVTEDLNIALDVLSNDLLQKKTSILNLSGNAAAAGDVIAVTADGKANVLLGIDGKLHLDPLGTYDFLKEGEHYQTTFIYNLGKGSKQTDSATVTLNLAGLNDAPSATSKTYSIGEGSALIIPAGDGLLKGASDPDGDPLMAVLGDGPAHGSVAMNADGSFVYTPTDGFFGTDTFTFRSFDGTAYSDPVTVTLTVNDVPEPVKIGVPSIGSTIGVLGEGAGAYYAQTFIAAGTNPIDLTIQLLNNQNDDAPGPFNFEIKIVDATFGTPTGNVLYSSGPLSVGVQRLTPVTVDLSDVELVTGHRYAWVIDTVSTRDGQDDYAQVAAAGNPYDGSAYPSGSMFTSGDSSLDGIWYQQSSQDLFFEMTFEAAAPAAVPHYDLI